MSRKLKEESHSSALLLLFGAFLDNPYNNRNTYDNITTQYYSDSTYPTYNKYYERYQ